MFQKFFKTNSKVKVRFYENGKDVPKYLIKKVEKTLNGKNFQKELDKKNRKFFFFFPVESNDLIGYSVVAKVGNTITQRGFGIEDSLPFTKTKQMFNTNMKRILHMEHRDSKVEI